MLALGLLVTLASLLLLGTALATVHWVDYIVNQESIVDIDGNRLDGLISSSVLYTTRYRGVFQTCYDFKNTSHPLLLELDAVDGCVLDPGITNYTAGHTNYDMRNHMLRASIILFFVTAFLLVVGLVVEIIGQCDNSFNKIKAAAVLIFLAAICDIAGMALFTAIKIIEDKQLDCCGFPASWTEPKLQTNTQVKFWYSYFIGWVSAGVGLAAPFIFCNAGKADDERVDWQKSHRRDSGYGHHEHMVGIPNVTKRDSHSKKKKLDYGVNEPQKIDSIYSWGYAGDANRSSKKSHGSRHSTEVDSSEKYILKR